MNNHSCLRRALVSALVVLGLWPWLMAAQPAKPLAAADANQKVRVLIVTGVDWPGHYWKTNGPALRQVLEANPRVDARLVEDPGFLSSDLVFRYDVVVLQFKNYEPVFEQAQAQAHLLRFVEQGGGLVVVHYASGAFEDWPEYRHLIGRTQLKKHDPRGPFRVEIVNHTHPITAGLEAFDTDDELFIELQGDDPIEVLATAHSKLTGRDHPMAFVRTQGQGRVFHTTLGHDARALQMPGTAELIRRGVLWAAGGKSQTPAAR